jgi:hypothetical protein
LRLTQKDFDMSTAAGLAKAVEAVTLVNLEGREVHLFGSLPCTAWSSWQFINESKLGENFQRKLKGKRVLSKRILRNFRELARHLITL